MTVSVALRDPVADGVKVTLMVHVPAAATDVPQLLVCEKSPLLVPVMAILVMVAAVLALFVRVIGLRSAGDSHRLVTKRSPRDSGPPCWA